MYLPYVGTEQMSPRLMIRDEYAIMRTELCETKADLMIYSENSECNKCCQFYVVNLEILNEK